MGEETQKHLKAERCLIVFAFQRETEDERRRRMAELSEIVHSCGGVVVGVVAQSLDRLHAKSLIGTGKVEEIAAAVEQDDIDLVVFEEELTGAQRGYLSDAISCKVLDRVDLILDIFAQRARTPKAKLDVALAQLEYRLPHLRGYGKALSREGGGIGTRGPGEQKLETDRRAIEARIKSIKNERERIATQEQESSKKRRQGALPIVSLIGYTNAGKSTLMNALVSHFGEADKAVYADDRLFATLSVQLRRIDEAHEPPYLLADTVGFIEDLPEKLINPFESTLSEVEHADLLVHVIDGSTPGVGARVETVMAQSAPYRKGASVLYVMNKADVAREPLASPPEETLRISAHDEEDVVRLHRRILDELYGPKEEREMTLPFDDLDVLSALHRHAEVLDEAAVDDGLFVRFRARPGFLSLKREAF
ncbi:MAG: GTPase HflX [Peptoniphilaceae bacterium]|nr:GTPase HflX [Peptoniphilaceae bacterium]MDY6085625.1 GTPase HflX [Peptoniphilaceae bacterium]